MKFSVHFDVGPFCLNLGGSATAPPTYIKVDDDDEVTDLTSSHPIGFQREARDDDDDDE